MAVYTHLSAEQLAELIGEYDVGILTSAKGIAEGVSNSNWLIGTTGKDGKGARFILTMYERRIEISDLPFFLGLLDHLASKGCPVPATIHDRAGASYRDIDGKAVALIEYLPGVSVDHPTPEQARSVGRALAHNHLAVADFPHSRPNTLGLEGSDKALRSCGAESLASIDASLPEIAFEELSALTSNCPRELPSGVVHCDLFPDNVLMLGDEVSGLIDFYFAATDFFAYDLAVTHAAWSFEPGGHAFREDVGRALLDGYAEIRQLSDAEHAAMPWLARGACLRFIASRAEDWLETGEAAHVTRKDPMDFVRRLKLYAENGSDIFAQREFRS